MRILHSTIVAVALTLVACSSPAPPPAAAPAVDKAAEEKAINDLGTKWLDAAAKQDVDTIVSLYAPDGAVVWPDAPAKRGPTGVREAWVELFKIPGVKLTFEYELGYTLDPAAWGQGFATEAACCVRDHARDVLRLPYAVSAILPQNVRSRRVAERQGACIDGQMEVVGRTFDRYLWPLMTSDETGFRQHP